MLPNGTIVQRRGGATTGKIVGSYTNHDKLNYIVEVAVGPPLTTFDTIWLADGVEPVAPEVNDTVRLYGSDDLYTVLGKKDDQLWVLRQGSRSPFTIRASLTIRASGVEKV